MLAYHDNGIHAIALAGNTFRVQLKEEEILSLLGLRDEAIHIPRRHCSSNDESRSVHERQQV
jgi:hypothetical protein